MHKLGVFDSLCHVSYPERVHFIGVEVETQEGDLPEPPSCLVRGLPIVSWVAQASHLPGFPPQHL